MSIQLTPQQEAVRQMMEDSQSPMRLQAPAGAGKTTTVNAMRCPVVKLAPTNKAALLMGGQTIHNFLHLGLKTKGDKQYTVATKKTPLTPYRGKVVIDEMSCIDKDLLERYVLPLLPNVVFTGDSHQLPPVNHSSIPVMELAIPEARLDFCHRFAGERLLIANDIRLSIEGQGEFAIPDKWKSSVVEDLGDEDVIVAWTNKAVNYYNARVKRARYGHTDWCVGERVRIGTFYEKDRLATESEWTVTGLAEGREGVYDCWYVTLDGSVTVPVLHDDCKEDFNQRLSTLAARKDWAYFWQMKASFCDLRPSFAITTYKSQGSTYRNVYVDFEDIFQNRCFEEAKRHAYVAITRASEGVRWIV